jgi:hypothetical protein
VLLHPPLTVAEEGVEVPLTDAPTGFVRSQPNTAEASVPEPTPDRLGVEAEAFGSLGYGQETVGIRQHRSLLSRV